MLEALNAHITLENWVLGEILDCKKIVGGYSNLTFKLSTASAHDILRMAPPGAKGIKGGHNMKREFEILLMLKKAGFDASPLPYYYCGDDAVLGAEFYIMEFVTGVVLRPSNIMLTHVTPDTMRQLSLLLCTLQANLHTLNIVESGLIAIGKPQNYISRQVNGWHERYLKSKTHEIPIELEIYEWLVKKMPKELAPTLIHNDFKFDNVMFSHDLSTINTVLDWEMCTVGDPRMDLGTTLSYWCEESDGSFEKAFNISWKNGCMTREEYLSTYKSLNPDIDLTEILYFYVFGLFKNAIVIQQIYSRFHQGLTNDDRFKDLDKGVQRLLSKANQSIELNKMK